MDLNLEKLVIPIETEMFQKLYNNLMNAWLEADEDTLDYLTDDEFLFVSNTIRNFHLDKTSWMEMLLQRFQLKSYKLDIKMARVRDCVATVLTHMSILSSINYSGVPHEYLVTDTWKCTNGIWRLFSRQVSPLPESSAPLV